MQRSLAGTTLHVLNLEDEIHDFVTECWYQRENFRPDFYLQNNDFVQFCSLM